MSETEPRVAVYTGSSIDALTEVASDNDTLGQQSRVQDLAVTAGQTYYIAVDGVGGATGLVAGAERCPQGSLRVLEVVHDVSIGDSPA